jgi:hypothetical protein
MFAAKIPDGSADGGIVTFCATAGKEISPG